MTARPTLTVLPDTYAVCRLEPDRSVPAWFRPGPLAALTYTDDELSIVAPDADVPEAVLAERGWRVFKVRGPLDFALTGILSSVATPLAEAAISILAVSTFDTDYVLVRADRLPDAIAVLRASFEIVGQGSPRSPDAADRMRATTRCGPRGAVPRRPSRSPDRS